MQNLAMKIGRVKVRTIDISAKRHQDRNGNSYFTAIVTLNAFLPSRTSFNLEYQYGYGDHYIYKAFEALKKRGFLKGATDQMLVPWQICRDLGIELRANAEQVRTMREVKRHVA